MRRRPALTPLLITLPAAAVFVLMARGVANGSARHADRAIRRRVRALRSPALDIYSAVITPLTAPALLIAGAEVLAFAMRRRGARVWLPIAASPLLAMTAGATFTKLLPQQNAPASEYGDCEPCFPSGHTTGAAAEALTIAWVLRRDANLGAASAAALLALPIIGGLNRLYRDRHWATDIAAGLSAGACIASLLALASDAIASPATRRAAAAP
jgi:undecaprenyl-diphosphatase